MTTTKTRRPSAAKATVSATTQNAPHDLTAAEVELMQQGAEAEVSQAATTTAAQAPTMAPPGTTLGALPTAAGASISGQKVTATWAEQSNRNAWAHLETAGWKRLGPLTDTGSTTMTLLAAHARATGSAPYVDENPAGTLGVMYLW